MKVVNSLGFQQLTAANLAASFPLTLPIVNGAKPNAAYMTASATAVRYRDDGAAPTAAIGMRLPVGIEPFLFQGDLEKFRAILESGTPTLDVNYVTITD